MITKLLILSHTPSHFCKNFSHPPLADITLLKCKAWLTRSPSGVGYGVADEAVVAFTHRVVVDFHHIFVDGLVFIAFYG